MKDALRRFIPLPIAEFDDLNEEASDKLLAAYCRLMVKAWKSGGILPDNAATLTKIAKAPEPVWRIALSSFERSNDCWVHVDLRDDLERSKSVRTARQGAANARWEAVRQRAKVVPMKDRGTSK